VREEAWSSRGDGDLLGGGFEGLELFSEVRRLEDDAKGSGERREDI